MTHPWLAQDKVITADARKVSGLEFFEVICGSTPERRAQLAEEGRQIADRIAAKQRSDILEIRENICRLLSPEREAEARAEWALQDQVADELAFTIGNNERRRAAR